MPLSQLTSSASMRTRAKKCSAEYTSAVSTTAAFAPDSRWIAVNIAPRRKVSSINATVSPLSTPWSTSFPNVAAAGAAPPCQSRRPSAAMSRMTGSISAAPRASALAISRTKTVRGRP